MKKINFFLCLCFFWAGSIHAQSKNLRDESAPQTFSLGGKPVLRIETDSDHALIPVLSWDTEGGDRAKMNLLRAPVTLRTRVGGQWREAKDFQTRRETIGKNGVRYILSDTRGAETVWEIEPSRGSLSMNLFWCGRNAEPVEEFEIIFPFDPRAAATTVFPSDWNDDGSLRLPAIICAPDFGQMILSCNQAGIIGRLEGSRAKQTVDFILQISKPAKNRKCKFELKPSQLSPPRELKDKTLWPLARRGWVNMFQPSARWGDPGNPYSAPAGILANNVISDPVSCLIYLYGDQALLLPQLAPKISAAAMVRCTIDWWLDARTKPSGEVIAYWAYVDMLDADASPLIAAWDYVEATGDKKWLARRIAQLEKIAEYLASRDIDGDGLVEATHSGNYGTLKNPMRSDSAYDTINAGHKDAYSNELIYRAWRCLADLEKKLNRREQQARCTQLADRLKAIFFKTFYNPATGWLVWWKSADGELHDCAAPMISSLAIEYGLVELAQGREILARLWKKIDGVGFTRFDLGLPLTLVPVRRGDYLQPEGIPGCPHREDGSDTFGQYLNGGCLVSDTIHFLAAHYILGEDEKAERILHAMLERQARGVFPNGGGFQNGIINQYPKGAEFFTWDGKTTGYEGHLTYSFSFLQAVMLREPQFRARLYRPLMGK